MSENENQLQVKRLYHSQWLESEITRESKKRFDKLRANIVKHLSVNGVNEEFSPTQAKLFAAQLNMLDKVEKQIYDTETFISQS